MPKPAFSLIDLTDQHFCRNRISLPRQTHFRPSEASVQWRDSDGDIQTSGTCARAVFFRYTGVTPTGPKTPYSEWIFALGKSVEEILVEQWKQMGIWVANNIDFYWPEYNIKGELDVILREPDTGRLFVTEVKSFYGYQATRDICGNAKVKGKPKTSQMLQALVYLYRFQDQFPYAKMVYYARDSAKRAEFDLTLVSEGENMTRVAINGEVDERFYIENVLNRYREIDQYVQMGQIPPPDYELEWSAEKVEHEHKKGNVSKTSFEKWSKSPKKNPVGSWQCRYCNFSQLCWGKTIGEEEE